MSASAGNGSAATPVAAGGGGFRPSRLPRWTRQEILVLIEGKRAVEGRGKGRSAASMAAAGTASMAVLEPKWAAVSAHCRRRGVDRGPVQCRKRWSNLAGDFKKIKEWEQRRTGEADDGKESFWAMRNDARRERRLPGFFDREVFDVLEGGPVPLAIAAVSGVVEEEEEVKLEEEEEEDEAVFDSGRTAAEDGLFSDEDDKETEEAEDEKAEAAVAAEEEQAVAVTPISEKRYKAFHQELSDSGILKDKQPAENPETGTLPSQGQKRKRTSQEGSVDHHLQAKLVEVLEKNSRMLTAQLEAQNVNNQLEREQRKDQTNSLLAVLSKVADALGRIADKL